MIKVACVACLDASRSVHTEDFLRAKELAVEYILGDKVDIKLFDDRADAGTAADIAKDIVEFSPDCVVGHFSSAAAKAAIPLYAKYKLPLILPAATMSDLTDSDYVYRICDNDEDYCHWLSENLEFSIKEFFCDGSAHGESIMKHFKLLPQVARPAPLMHDSAVLFSGSYSASIEFVTRHPIGRIVLTDDADAKQLIDDLSSFGIEVSKTDIFVGCLSTQPQGELAQKINKIYEERFNSKPGTYFWELIASLQIAAVRGWTKRKVETVLGTVSFDAKGEARPKNFSLWNLKDNPTKFSL